MNANLEILIALSKTRVPTIIGFVGSILIFVALGGEVTWVIGTENMNQIAAGIVGTILLVLSILIYLRRDLGDGSAAKKTRDKHQDPFFNYYIASVLVILSIFWIIVSISHGEDQLDLVRSEFIGISSLIIILLIWRYWTVNAFVNGRIATPPIGFLEATPNFLPYFFLIGTTIILFVLLTYLYASNNFSFIISDFLIFLIILAVFRLIWEFIDRKAENIQKHNQPA